MALALVRGGVFADFAPPVKEHTPGHAGTRLQPTSGHNPRPATIRDPSRAASSRSGEALPC